MKIILIWTFLKKTSETWIKNLRHGSSHKRSKLVLYAKVSWSAVWSFLKITLKFWNVFFDQCERVFPNVWFLTKKKWYQPFKVIFWIRRACSCHQNLCLSTWDGSLEDPCLGFWISQTHSENDFFPQFFLVIFPLKWTFISQTWIVQLPHPDQ